MSASTRKTKPIKKIPPLCKSQTRSRLRPGKVEQQEQPEAKEENKNIDKTSKSNKKMIDLLNAKEIPYSHLIFSGDRVPKQDRLQHIMNCYFGIKYISRMRHLTSEQKTIHKLNLPTDNLGQRTLFLDLDETLIHASTNSKVKLQNSVKFECDGTILEVTFSLRPYCLNFLESVSKHYEIYIFTASYNQYAKAVMDFLNQKKQTITGFLSRQNCLQTKKGLYIKDLVRVGNRSPQQMLIVDNLVHSFGQQVDNGIPILEYNGNPQDEELFYLEKYLLNCSKSQDLREFNKSSLKLGDILVQMSQYFEESNQSS